MRDWKGWENSGPMKSVDAVVKEHRLFIVLVVLKKKVRSSKGKHIQYMHAKSIIRLLFYLLTISLRNVYF